MGHGTRRPAAIAALLAGAFAVRAGADEAGSSTPLADDRALLALAVGLSCTEGSAAVGDAPADPVQPPPPGPALELVATVRAKALTFQAIPILEVPSRGAGGETICETERTNLPHRPERGVVYRHVTVRLTLRGDAAALTALLREATRVSGGVLVDEDRTEIARGARPAVPAAVSPGNPHSPRR
jgi:hypothetical protein